MSTLASANSASQPVPGLLQKVAAAPYELGLVDRHEALRWPDVASRVLRAANALAAIVPSGGRLAVMGENTADTVMTYAGAVLAGVGAVLLNTHLKVDEVAYILRDSGAAVIWADTEHLAVAAGAAAKVGGVMVVAPGPPAAGRLGWDALLGAASEDLPPLDGPRGKNLLYTSGTTGFPKGVFSRRHEGADSLRDFLRELGTHYATGIGPHLVAGPLYHAGPHSAIGVLLAGTPVVLQGRFDPERTLALIDEHRVASSIMVPTHFVRMLALSPELRARYDVSSVKIVGQTGAACPIPVKQAMIEWFGPVFRESYGGTESGILTIITSADWLEHQGSVGRVQPGFEVVVVDEDGDPVPAGTEGRLYFRDRSGRGLEYHNDPEKSAAAHIAPGVFTLGEVGYVDPDGWVYITDRFSHMVVSGGVNIYPAECERVLLDHPDVLDAAVFGVADEEMGERLVGAVVRRDGGSEPDELIAHCRARLAHYKVPRDLRIVDALPRNAMGKLEKRQLPRLVGLG